MLTLALSELLGATVYDPSGASGRVREVTLAPQEDRSRISSLIVKTKSGNRVVAICGGLGDQWRHSHDDRRRQSGRPSTAPKVCFCWNAICSTSR